MRVTFVLTLDRGGPVSHVLDLAPRVAALGHEVDVVCGTDASAGRFRELGLAAVSVPVRSKFDAPGAVRLARAVPRGGVVHSHDRRAGLFARVAARGRGASVVHTYHGLPEEIAVSVGRPPEAPAETQLAGARGVWLEHGYFRVEAALARLGRVITPSRAMADFLETRGLPSDRLHVVPSGVEVRSRQAMPRHSPFRISVLANLEPWKGVDLAVDACATLDLPYHLDVFGDGSQRSALEDRAARLGVAATFHGHVGDARDRLRSTDLVVVPSRAENLPIVILEAMATALPVVATHVGGVPELVADGATGRVVAPDDAAALAAAIATYASDESLRRRHGEAAAARAAASFDPGEVAGRVVSVYEEACASSR